MRPLQEHVRAVELPVEKGVPHPRIGGEVVHPSVHLTYSRDTDGHSFWTVEVEVAGELRSFSRMKALPDALDMALTDPRMTWQ